MYTLKEVLNELTTKLSLKIININEEHQYAVLMDNDNEMVCVEEDKKTGNICVKTKFRGWYRNDREYQLNHGVAKWIKDYQK